jgi:hypothetical protein
MLCSFEGHTSYIAIIPAIVRSVSEPARAGAKRATGIAMWTQLILSIMLYSTNLLRNAMQPATKSKLDLGPFALAVSGLRRQVLASRSHYPFSYDGKTQRVFVAFTGSKCEGRSLQRVHNEYSLADAARHRWTSIRGKQANMSSPAELDSEPVAALQPSQAKDEVEIQSRSSQPLRIAVSSIEVVTGLVELELSLG